LGIWQGIYLLEFRNGLREREIVITVYSDRSFTFVTKTPPAAVLLKKAAGIKSGSGKPNKDKVGKVTRAQVREIAETKASIVEKEARKEGFPMRCSVQEQ